MKSSIFIVVLLFSFSALAEDIVGFDFGGKFTEHNKYKEITDPNRLLPHEFTVNKVKFFDSAQVGTDKNKKIKSLSFTKQYKFTIHTLSTEKETIANDYKRILSSLEKRYGKFNTEQSKSILGLLGQSNGFYIKKVNEASINKSPKSKSLGVIILALQSEEDKTFMLGSEKIATLSLVYMDKHLFKKIKNKKKDEVSGF